MIQYHEGFLDPSGLYTPICHCIATDRACGAGFAAQIPAQHLARLRAKPEGQIGQFYITRLERIDKPDFIIAHLLTKKRSCDKPTLRDFQTAVMNFTTWALAETKHHHWHCPQMGSGLDRLSWKQVSTFLEGLPITFHVWVPENNPIPITE